MRFNFRTKEKTAVNHEGAKAYTLTPEMELYPPPLLQPCLMIPSMKKQMTG